jgi:hypothetical protein
MIEPMRFKEPWFALDDPAEVLQLRAELLRELPPTHVLASRSLHPIARRQGRDADDLALT